MTQWKIIVQYKGKLYFKYLDINVENLETIRTTILIRDFPEPNYSHDFVCYLNNNNIFIPNTCIIPKNNNKCINLHVKNQNGISKLFSINLGYLAKFSIIPDMVVDFEILI